MKSFALLALGASVAMALPQSTDSLPQCGQTCINNMIQIATNDFGCAAGDVVCYCTNADFGYGVRDCSNESCSAEEASQVISFGTNYCAGAASSAGPSASAISTGALSILSSALATATGTAGASGTGSPQSSLTESAGSAISSAASSLESALSSVTASLASELSSLTASASGALSSGLESATSAAGSALESATGTGAPAESSGGAPKMTGLPIAGAAGIAAWLLL